MTLQIQINLTADEKGEFTAKEHNVLQALTMAGVAPGQPFTPPAPADAPVAAEAPKAAAPAPAVKAPVKRAVKAAPAAKASTGPAVLEEDPAPAGGDAADPADVDDAARAAAGDPDDDVLGGDEPEFTYDDVLGRATELAAKSKQPEIKKVLKEIGNFTKVRELESADADMLKAFMDGLKGI